MKLKGTYILSEVCDEIVAVPVGDAAAEFSGVIRLNKTGAEIFRCLQAEMKEAQIVEALLEKFDGIDRKRASEDVQNVLKQLEEAGIVGNDQ